MKTPREKEIDKILENIRLNWYIVPEQRLGQFLSNYVFGHHTDPFYWRDERLVLKESRDKANHKPTSRKSKQNTKLALDKKKAIQGFMASTDKKRN
jgi:hypothetical protein